MRPYHRCGVSGGGVSGLDAETEATLTLLSPAIAEGSTAIAGAAFG